MRRYLLLLAAFLPFAAMAQQKTGTFSVTPKVGIAVSNFSGNTPVRMEYVIIPDGYYHEISTNLQPYDESMRIRSGGMVFDDNKNKVGFTIGAEGQYQFTSVLGLSLGVFYTQEGATYKTKGFSVESDVVKIDVKDDVKIRLNSITLPVLANVYVWKGLAFKTGFQPEFAVGKK